MKVCTYLTAVAIILFTGNLCAIKVQIYNNTPFEFDSKMEIKGLPEVAQRIVNMSINIGAFNKVVQPDLLTVLSDLSEPNAKPGQEPIFLFTLKPVGEPRLQDGQTISLAMQFKGGLRWGYSLGQFNNEWYDKSNVSWENPKDFCLKSAWGDSFIQAKCRFYDDKLEFVLSMPDVPTKANFDEGFYLTSHNSYSTGGQGYMYSQQNLSISEQLKYGVRGLMLDTYEKDGKVVLAHGNLGIDYAIRIAQNPQPLQEVLRDVDSFFKTNSVAVISIFLENYVKNWSLLTNEFKTLEKYLYKPSDLVANGGKWPTLEWMRKNNKRVVVFCPGSSSSDNFFNEWRYHIENQYSTTDKVKAATERNESKTYLSDPRTLYLFNFFPEYNESMIRPVRGLVDAFGKPSHYWSINGDELVAALKYAVYNGLEGRYKNKTPNYIALDFVEEGAGLAMISKWNGFVCKGLSKMMSLGVLP